MESLNSNSQERKMLQLQQMQDKAKEKCMESFRLLHSHLKVLSIKVGFERACMALLNQDNQTFTESLLLNLGNLEKQLDREEFQETESIKYTRTEIQQFRDALIQHMKSVKKSIDERAQHKRENNRRVNDRVMQSKEGKVDSSTTLDVGLVVTESNETESERHVSSSRSEKDTHAEDAEINSVNDKQPLAEVQLTVQHDTLANGQQHYVQSEPIYDTHMLEKVDRNTIPDSTNMCHRGGEIERNAEKCQVSCPLLDLSFDNMTTEFSNQSLESENIFLKKTVAQLQKDFSRMETHCVNMELKYQNQALKDGQQGQILNETSNKAKINKENKVLEKINIEWKHIKTVENVDLKAQIQEKVFANVALKNKLRKLKGNSVDTKFAKASILGKQVPTGKTFTSSTTKVDCEPPNGSNDYITNPYKCNQTLNVSAGTLNLSADQHPCFMMMVSVDNTSGPAPQRKEECTLQCALSSKEEKSSCHSGKTNVISAENIMFNLLLSGASNLTTEGEISCDLNCLMRLQESSNLLKKVLLFWVKLDNFNTDTPTSQAQVTYVSESVLSSKFNAKTFITWKES
ncbi:hypothetical protein Tco_0969074 [Tanacetum coccineum]